jgi:hypothetical protein
LKFRAGVEIGAANNDKPVKHITVLPPLLFFIGLAVPKSILVLDCLDCMTKLSLVSTDKVEGGLDMVKLSRSVSDGCSGNSPNKV